MFNLEAHLSVPDVDLALLLSYCASLAHVEQELLDGIVDGEGASDVVIVLDEVQYRETFSEAAALLRVGVDYRVHSARLPVRGPAFHPKLYLLASKHRLRAIVGSANLTLFGCRVNVEVGATLDLTRDAPEEARAFADLAGFLERLPEVVEIGGAEDVVNRAAEWIRKVLPNSAPLSGKRLLHSLNQPILEQVAEVVPPEEVRAFHVISPYFDRDGRTLSRLRSVYSDAEMTVWTRPNAAGTLNGASVARFPSPPTLEVVTGAEGLDRRLHAKMVRFETDSGVWTLTGSPNASEPGMLKSVPQGGNVELALLALEDLRSGLGVVDTRKDEWSSLTYRGRDVPGIGGEDRSQSLSVLSALFDGDRLAVALSGQWDEATDWSLYLATSRGEEHLPVRADLKDSSVVLQATMTGSEIREEPMVVRVVAHTSEGDLEGRAWLNQTSLLRRTGWERRSHRLAARVEDGRGLSDTESKALADIVLHLLGEICAPPVEPSPSSELGGSEKETSEEASKRQQTIAVKDLIGAGADTQAEARHIARTKGCP